MPTIYSFMFIIDGIVFLASLLELFVILLQSLSHIMDASMEDLARCPGIGERKVFFHCFLSYSPFSFLFFYPSCFLFFFCLFVSFLLLFFNTWVKNR